MSNEYNLPDGVSRVREMASADPPALVHAGWAEAFPWLIQGTTTRGRGDVLFDLGLFSGGSAVAEVEHNWERLRLATGMTRVVHARQLHEADVLVHGVGPAGLSVGGPCDGHATEEPGVLLAVTTADCVPVFLAEPERRAIAALHAGWRGVAAGVLERGLNVISDELGSRVDELHVHFGPAICGDCYEVGPEVYDALGLPAPAEPTPIDLRVVLAERAVAAGVLAPRISISEHCTRCSQSGLFSHRGGDAHRQAAYLGMRA